MVLTRRQVLTRFGLGLAAVPLVAACGSSNSDDGTTDDMPGDDTPDDDMPGDDTPGDGVDAATTDAPAGTDWASGGTIAMTDKDTYPDPFAGGPGAMCLLVATTTEGPCNTPTNLVRQDVSEGLTGLPVRLALKVVDTACNPIANASVKIWATRPDGIYTGETPNQSFCSENNAGAIATDAMRGVQVTDASGVVAFDTCYPGWYPGRAIHIHFLVTVGGATTRISQLFFPETVTQGIFASHPDYAEFGQPNTTFANDGVIGAIPPAQRDRLICDVARMTDGAMLASKVVAVRT
jgi:protocatechuate 3,4-dioxygenase beta subunit